MVQEPEFSPATLQDCCQEQPIMYVHMLPTVQVLHMEMMLHLQQSAVIPTLTTTAVTSIALTTAASGGNITSDGGASITARGVCWATTQNPVIRSKYTTDGTINGGFSSTITGLTKVQPTMYVHMQPTVQVLLTEISLPSALILMMLMVILIIQSQLVHRYGWLKTLKPPV